MKRKTIATVLALFLGGIGIHKFYVDRVGQGILYGLFCWTGIPAIVAFFEGLIWAFQSEAVWNKKYSKE